MPTSQNLDNLVPSTELECVNAVIGVAGENPVENLNDPVPANVEFALNLIRQIARGVQSKGWHFNTVRALRLNRDPDSDPANLIAVPANTLRLRKTVADNQRNFDFSMRGGFLWDNTTNSSQFDGDDYANGVLVDVVFALDFSALPESARQLIMVMAGRRYQERVVGNAEISGFGEKDEALALQNLIDAEGLLEETNLLFNFKDERRANEIWNTVSKDVQMIGWRFNTRLDVGIAPDPDDGNFIKVPENTLKISLTVTNPNFSSLDVVLRGSYLFDRKNNTYSFDPTQFNDGQIHVDLVEYLDFNELPPSARRYIEIKASRQLDPQKQVATAQNYSARDEYLAYRALQEDQGVDDLNMADDISVGRVLFGRPAFYGAGRFC